MFSPQITQLYRLQRVYNYRPIIYTSDCRNHSISSPGIWLVVTALLIITKRVHKQKTTYNNTAGYKISYLLITGRMAIIPRTFNGSTESADK